MTVSDGVTAPDVQRQVAVVIPLRDWQRLHALVGMSKAKFAPERSVHEHSGVPHRNNELLLRFDPPVPATRLRGEREGQGDEPVKCVLHFARISDQGLDLIASVPGRRGTANCYATTVDQITHIEQVLP